MEAAAQRSGAKVKSGPGVREEGAEPVASFRPVSSAVCSASNSDGVLQSAECGRTGKAYGFPPAPSRWFSSDPGRDPSQPQSADEISRNAREEAALRDRIGLIAQVFSGNFKMQLLPALNGGWSCTVPRQTREQVQQYMHGERPSLSDIPDSAFKADTIYYDPGEIRHTPELEVFGVLRHEIGHANHSDFRLLFEGQRMALDQGFMPTTWMSVHNPLEDPWVNEREAAGSDGARRALQARYRAALPRLLERINDQPLSRQLGLNIIHYWLTGTSIPTLKSTEVRKVFDEIRPFVDDYFRGESAHGNFRLLQQKIWPAVKVVQEAAVREEMQRQAVLILVAGDGDGGGSLGSLVVTGAGLEALRGAAGAGADGGQRIDLDQLPPELRRQIKEAIERLTEEQRRALQEKAEAEVDRAQAEALEADGPKVLETIKDPKTGRYLSTFRENPGEEEQQQSRDLAEQCRNEREARNAAGRPQSMVQVPFDHDDPRDPQTLHLMTRYGFEPDEAQLFAQFMALETPMLGTIREFVRGIEPYLPRNAEFNFEGEHYTGPKLDLRKISLRAPVQDWRLRQRRYAVPTGEPLLYVSLAIDNSGSMSGVKMNESLRTAVFWARVLDTLQIPFAVHFFASRVRTIKHFADPYDDPRMKIRPRLLKYGDASGGSTNIGAALRVMQQNMTEERRRYPRSYGAMFVVSDSGANDGLSGQPLTALIRELQRTLLVQSFILGSSAAEVSHARQYFGEENTVDAGDFRSLPQLALIALRGAIHRAISRTSIT